MAMRIVVASASIAIGVALAAAKFHGSATLPPPTVIVTPDQLIADGYDSSVLTIRTEAAGTPDIRVSGVQGVHIDNLTGGAGNWRVRVRAGIVAGTADIRISFAKAKPGSAKVGLSLDPRDSAEDGTPDFLRLEDEQDRRAFRQWFTFLAEAQFFQTPSERPAEINDCAALIRYAYREALIAHDGAWAASSRLPLAPALESPAKYQYPYTPLGPALFRTKAGAFRPADLADGTFLQFADARSLWRFNSHFVSRDLERALPGDLLFYRQSGAREPFHSMIYLGPSRMRPDGERYVIYHTGPQGNDPGEIKRLTLGELREFPQSEWRPLASNPSFLGVFQWNILRRYAE